MHFFAEYRDRSSLPEHRPEQLGSIAKEATVKASDKMDHSKHIPLRSDELTETNLDGAAVYGPDDSKIGSVAHLHGVGTNAKVIVDVGGFLGIGAKPVALDISSLNFMRDESGDVHATSPMTKDQLKELPEHHH